ncbi:MAG: F0F1 ATP synthase subunit A [Flavobacteriales bacterium]|nr:F0F1 ATP synthase subunit A [Flavobacteriales bacterium]
MELSPDHSVYWQHGFLKLNLTIITTWVLMLVLSAGAWVITRRLSTGEKVSRWQAMLEILVLGIRDQIGGIGLQQPQRYIGFLGTLFLFISFSNLCVILPGYVPPTGSLSTTAALALCVFLAVPLFGIRRSGLRGYLSTYLKPTPFMLPFNLIGEVSRTLALAVRLFGNIMSGTVIVGILVSITPLLFPAVMNALGLLTGMIQAYIFSVLATVYIAAATREGGERPAHPDQGTK